jgi:hypothetical protein
MRRPKYRFTVKTKYEEQTVEAVSLRSAERILLKRLIPLQGIGYGFYDRILKAFRENGFAEATDTRYRPVELSEVPLN